LATFDSLQTQTKLVKVALGFINKTNLRLYTGNQETIKWQWMNGDKMLSNFWGPGEPSGKGYCGSLLNGHCKGWLWYDESCEISKQFICEETARKCLICNIVCPVFLQQLLRISLSDWLITRGK
jgi:hypothetical protein